MPSLSLKKKKIPQKNSTVAFFIYTTQSWKKITYIIPGTCIWALVLEMKLQAKKDVTRQESVTAKQHCHNKTSPPLSSNIKSFTGKEKEVRVLVGKANMRVKKEAMNIQQVCSPLSLTHTDILVSNQFKKKKNFFYKFFHPQ